MAANQLKNTVYDIEPPDELPAVPQFEIEPPEAFAVEAPSGPSFADRAVPFLKSALPPTDIKSFLPTKLKEIPFPNTLETAGKKVKGAVQESIGNVVAEAPQTKVPFTNIPIPEKARNLIQTVKGGVGGTVATAAELAPFSPSEFANWAAGEVGGGAIAEKAAELFPRAAAFLKTDITGPLADRLQYTVNQIKYKLGIPQETGLTSWAKEALTRGAITPADAAKMDQSIYDAMLAERTKLPTETPVVTAPEATAQPAPPDAPSVIQSSDLPAPELVDAMKATQGDQTPFALPGMGVQSGTERMMMTAKKLGDAFSVTSANVTEAMKDATIASDNALAQGAAPEQAELASNAAFWARIPLRQALPKLGVAPEAMDSLVEALKSGDPAASREIMDIMIQADPALQEIFPQDDEMGDAISKMVATESGASGASAPLEAPPGPSPKSSEGQTPGAPQFEIEPPAPDPKDLADMRSEIQQGEAGQRLFVRERPEDSAGSGTIRDIIRQASTFPEYFQNKGYTKNQVLNIIDKYTNGKPLTENQKAIFEDLVSSRRELVERSKANETARVELEAKAKSAKDQADFEKFSQDLGSLKETSYDVLRRSGNVNEMFEFPKDSRVEEFRLREHKGEKVYSPEEIETEVKREYVSKDLGLWKKSFVYNVKRAVDGKLLKDTPMIHIDFDNLKALNSKLGHVDADQMFDLFSQTLSEYGFQAARVGGDEFVIMLNPVTKGGANPFEVLERFKEFQQHMANAEIFNPDTDEVIHRGLTMSAGFGTDMRSADDMAIRAKTDGKNKILLDKKFLEGYNREEGSNYEWTTPNQDVLEGRAREALSGSAPESESRSAGREEVVQHPLSEEKPQELEPPKTEAVKLGGQVQEQGLLPGTPARTLPPTGLESRRAQSDDLLGGFRAAPEQPEFTIEPPRFSSVGGGTPPEKGLVVANIDREGKIYYGSPGDIHATLSERYPHVDRGNWKDTGFADSNGDFFNREEAYGRAQELKLHLAPNTGSSLDTTDLRGEPSFKSDVKVSDIIKESKEKFTSPSLKSEIIPGAKEFAEQDLLPALKEAGANLQKLGDDVQKAFAPITRGPIARLMGGMLRENLARLAQKKEQVFAAFAKASKAMDSLPQAVNYDFIDKMEMGQPQTRKELQPLADPVRKLYDDRWRQAQIAGGKHFEEGISNYFAHIWEDPKKAGNVFSRVFGKKPLEGPKSFLKKRTIPTFKEGIAMGLKPVTDNPIDLTLLKIHEMDRYIMGQETFKEMKDQGLAKFIRFGGKVPDNYVKIDDKIAKVFQYSEAGKGMIVRGEYYAPEPAAKIINNYLAPGLKGNAAYDAFRSAGNFLNQAQLGLSAFHLAFVSMDANISKVALGLQQLSQGMFKPAVKSIASGTAMVIEPFTTYLKGDKVLKEYFSPGSQGQDIGAMVDALIKAGGRVKMDSFYKNSAVESFWKALRSGNYPGTGLRAPGALIEAMAKPIMENIVPRMKLGVFSDMARFELGKLGKDANPNNVREALGRAWDSVDNRLGQVVYDNLFWKRTIKDLGLASVRSLGWNLGTFRELGGGIKDIGTQISKASKGERPEVTARMGYLIALPFLAGLYGALYQKMKTGKGPEELKDYYFPKTGEINPDGSPERISLPSYMKDIYAYYEAPVKTVSHKLHPVISAISQMLENKDYYGTEIRNADDSKVKQVRDMFEFALKQFEPFSLRNYQQRIEKGGSKSQAVQSFFGITPAPASIDRTDTQERISDYLKAKGVPVKTKEQFETSKTVRGMIQKGRAGVDIMPALSDMEQGDAKKRSIAKRTLVSPLQDSFKMLPLSQALTVFEKATSQERSELEPLMTRKMATGMKLAPPSLREKYIQRFEAVTK